jgi:hypothetical protein
MAVTSAELRVALSKWVAESDVATVTLKGALGELTTRWPDQAQEFAASLKPTIRTILQEVVAQILKLEAGSSAR